MSVELAPGSIVEVRDEQWLVTKVESVAGSRGSGDLVTVKGLSDLVRDTDAQFYSALDDITPFDPAEVRVVGDDSPHNRRTRLWLQATFNKIPVPQSDRSLVTVNSILANSLRYQHEAVAKALDPAQVKPRILIADAVGLGKTLEIGMILTELTQRGRGDRVLIVTPKHVLEQIQHELWCRFALPFVRLDSVGIQRVRREIPATRNPFSFYKKAIISIDTLKSERYKAHLKKVHWDAVVIDESHNLTNRGTKNNALAQILAPNTEALILASATPHNGKAENFAEMLRLLDPVAVKADNSVDAAEVERLIVRRHRHSPSVAAEVGADWAERGEPLNIMVAASPQEDAVAAELAGTWLHPLGGLSPQSGAAKGLFPWVMAKAFLSSPAALADTLKERLKKVAAGPERVALTRLQELNAAVAPGESAKFNALVQHLAKIGVTARGDIRAVVFGERVATLKWLQAALPGALKLKPENVAVLHGGLSDVEQQSIVDDFKQSSSKVRVLVTGDVASEGVNLHAQCHNLVHFDIPWSLIRIEQRNGRIDRYGQRFAPLITTLLLQPSHEKFRGDLRVLSRLLEREREAHMKLGDTFSIMGKYSVEGEETELAKVLAGQLSFDKAVPTIETALSDDDAFDALFGGDFGGDMGAAPAVPVAEVVVAKPVSLYREPVDFLADALAEAYAKPSESLENNGVGWWMSKPDGIARLTPPSDLQQRMAQLPQSYLKDRKVTERLQLALTHEKGTAELRRGLQGINGSTWPEAHYLGPLHPVLEWAADKALAAVGRNEVFAVRGLGVSEPEVLLLGTIMNARGGVVSKVFMRSYQQFGVPSVEVVDDVVAYLQERGLTNPDAVNPGAVGRLASYQGLIPQAVTSAFGYLNSVFAAAKDDAQQRFDAWMARYRGWDTDYEQASLFGAAKSVAEASSRRIAEEKRTVETLMPSRTLVRPLLVVV